MIDPLRPLWGGATAELLIHVYPSGEPGKVRVSTVQTGGVTVLSDEEMVRVLLSAAETLTAKTQALEPDDGVDY